MRELPQSSLEAPVQLTRNPDDAQGRTRWFPTAVAVAAAGGVAGHRAVAVHVVAERFVARAGRAGTRAG